MSMIQMNTPRRALFILIFIREFVISPLAFAFADSSLNVYVFPIFTCCVNFEIVIYIL